MKLAFKESFAKDLRRISDKDLLKQIRRILTSAATVCTLQEIAHLKKLRESGNCFRIRVGQYRIGLVVEKDEIIFVRCLHRRDVYRYFP